MKPFLKWAGGKSRLVPTIAAMLPKGRRLVEPFMGSGAVFLGIRGFRSYLLADANQDLVTLFDFVKRDAEIFIDECERLFTPENNTAEAYTRLRAEFNSLPHGDPRRSQLFVYLNRHGFNGLCRYNRSGQFNVPFGNMKSPYFPRREMTAFATRAIHAEFRLEDFRSVMAATEKGDVVYCDPPYVALTATASFDAYSAGGFSAKDQEDLAQLCFDCAARGVPVLLSNHDTPFSRRLYDGSRMEALEVTRSISAVADTRGTASEILVLFKKGLRRSPQMSLFPGL